MEITTQEKKDFDELYEYLKHDILGYEGDMKVPTIMLKRIYGTAFGKLYHNSKQQLPFIYSFKIIHATLIFKKDDIKYCLDTMRFKDGVHLSNTIFKIVDENVNMIKMLVDKKAEVDDKLQEVDLSHMDREVQPYKSKDKFKDKFKEFM